MSDFLPDNYVLIMRPNSIGALILPPHIVC